MSDQEKRKILKGYLTQADVVEDCAERYADILFHHGVGSIERLRKKLDRNRSFLLELGGFDDVDADDILKFVMTASPSQASNSPRDPGNIRYFKDTIWIWDAEEEVCLIFILFGPV